MMRQTPGHGEAVPEISRGLSEATPPESRKHNFFHPEEMAE